MTNHWITKFLNRFIFAGAAVLVLTTSSFAVDFDKIRTSSESMTSITWKEYAKSLEGKDVEWSGWIFDVKEKMLGGIRVQIDMDPPDSISLPEIIINDIPKEIANNFNKNDKVTFSGVIKSVHKIIGVLTIEIETQPTTD